MVGFEFNTPHPGSISAADFLETFFCYIKPRAEFPYDEARFHKFFKDNYALVERFQKTSQIQGFHFYEHFGRFHSPELADAMAHLQGAGVITYQYYGSARTLQILLPPRLRNEVKSEYSQFLTPSLTELATLFEKEFPPHF